jgi:hypothetical protein
MGNHGLGAAWAVCLREATSDRLFDPSLTANLYTDPKLLDVAGGGGAVASLPDLPLGAVGGAGSALALM